MVKAVLKNVAYYTNINPKGFDTFICDDKKQIFAVFDGVGTTPGARRAAEKCAEIVGIVTKGGENWQDLRLILGQCNTAIRGFNDPQAACTATIASIDFNGHLHYAHMGDSRLYVVNNGRVKQITSDEGVGNQLLNSVGPFTLGVAQAGTVYDDWQKFMLCTDGITGDWKPNLISDDVIEQCLKAAAEQAALNVLAAAKKQDDKTVIVVER